MTLKYGLPENRHVRLSPIFGEFHRGTWQQLIAAQHVAAADSVLLSALKTTPGIAEVSHITVAASISLHYLNY